MKIEWMVKGDDIVHRGSDKKIAGILKRFSWADLSTAKKYAKEHDARILPVRTIRPSLIATMQGPMLISAMYVIKPSSPECKDFGYAPNEI
jgi:hypothetical protein